MRFLTEFEIKSFNETHNFFLTVREINGCPLSSSNAYSDHKERQTDGLRKSFNDSCIREI